MANTDKRFEVGGHGFDLSEVKLLIVGPASENTAGHFLNLWTSHGHFILWFDTKSDAKRGREKIWGAMKNI